jgi:allophanate hydrolase
MQFFGDEAAADGWRRSVLQARGAELTEIDLTPFQRAAELLYSGPFVAERYAAVGSFVASRPESDLDPTVRDIILGAAKYSAVDAFNAEYKLQDLRRTVNKIFESIDALLLPTAPSIYRIEEVRRNPVELNSRLGIYTNFVNLLDLCAIAVPAGLREDGLPFGVTLMAPAFSDAKLLRLAHWWEGSEPGHYLPQATCIQLAVVGPLFRTDKHDAAKTWPAARGGAAAKRNRSRGVATHPSSLRFVRRRDPAAHGHRQPGTGGRINRKRIYLGTLRS